MGDPFIREYIVDVVQSIRTQVLLDLIRPYTRIELNMIAKVISIILLYIAYLHCN
jgi:COP9 signalosome complex subunit 2